MIDSFKELENTSKALKRNRNSWKDVCRQTSIIREIYSSNKL